MICKYRPIKGCVETDIVLRLSFYKEELAGENNNYVHLRAAAEEIAPVEVLHRLTEEVLDTARRIDRIVCRDEELAELWEGYRQVRRAVRREGSMEACALTLTLIT